MENAKVVRLNCSGTTTEELLLELVDKHRAGKVSGMIICATVQEDDDTWRIRRWFFDKDRLCTTILGLWEYTKHFIIDYMRSEDGEL